VTKSEAPSGDQPAGGDASNNTLRRQTYNEGGQVSDQSDEHYPLDEYFDAAYEFIRRHGRDQPVTISEVIDLLSAKYGFRLTPEMNLLLWLIHFLLEDENVETTTDLGVIEFAWNERGREPDPVATGLKEALLRRPDAGNDDKGSQ
jgi:hypothetical protein